MEIEDFCEAIHAQFTKNLKKHNYQPLDVLLAVVGEEFGELCKAILENDKTADHGIKHECIDLAAVLLEIHTRFGD